MWVQCLGWENFPGVGHGNPLQYSCLENAMDRGARLATIHKVEKSQTWLERVSTHTSMTQWLNNNRAPRNRSVFSFLNSSTTAAAAAAAKSLQSCPTLCDPIDGSPPGSANPGILQARTLEWVAISLSNAWKWKVKVKSLSHVWLLVNHGLQPTRHLHPWDFPGKSTGVGLKHKRY